MKFIGLIPARYGSSRFPGKPLALLAGKPVIQHVYEQANKVLDAVFVATDDERIYNKVLAFGGKAVMTSTEHHSGTDRIEEAFEKIGGDFDVVVNIQGDEPFIEQSQIETLCHCFDDDHTQIATLGKPFADIEAVENPNSPKIVVDNRGYAMYFSRSIIPFVRGVGKLPIFETFGHLCLSQRHIKRDYKTTTIFSRIGRKSRTTALVAEWISRESRHHECRNSWYRHSRRPTTCRRFYS